MVEEFISFFLVGVLAVALMVQVQVLAQELAALDMEMAPLFDSIKNLLYTSNDYHKKSSRTTS